MSAPPGSFQAHNDMLGFTVPATRKERRLKAAQLLEAVIEESIEPRMAINRWPESQNTPDPSLDCAFIALWHFEADESQQKTELFYMDTQLELLRQIAEHLKAGHELPPYILRTYLPNAPVRFYYPRSVRESGSQFITKLWGQIKTIWFEALSLLQAR